MRDNFIGVQTLLDEVANLDADADPAKVQDAINKIGELYQSVYGAELSDAQKADLSENFSLAANDILVQAQAAITAQIDASKDTVTDNPMLAYLQTMLDSGSFDNLDVTKLDGGLENAFKAIDLVGRGTDVGTDLVNGITAGIGKRAGELTSDDLATLRDKVIEQTRAVFDSHSPAQVMVPIGEDVTAGLTEGMTDDAAQTGITAAAAAIQAALKDALDLDMSDPGKSAISSFTDGMQDKRSAAVAKAKSIATSTKSAMYLYTAFYRMGQSNMDGFIEGLESKSTDVTSAITALMQEAIQAAKDALQQKSPSRVFREIGKYSAMGYEVGFAERMEQADQLIQQSLLQSARVPETGETSAAASRSAASGTGGISLTQNIYANETSYAGQQKEAMRQARQLARHLER